VSRLLPYPLAAVGLLGLWLVLNQAISVGHLLLGATAALAGGWALRTLQLPEARVRRLRILLRLAGVVLADIVRSNVAVAGIITGLAPGREWRSGFVNIPIELRNAYGLTALACIITSTPGTLWVDFDPERRMLMLHVLDLINEGEWVEKIKQRYERPLMEILE
jgi:multicomponent K+:H+ antiporter subunit E